MKFSSVTSLLTAASFTAAQSCLSGCKPFTIDVTWGPTDPANALSRNGILTNGSLPGPPLKLNVGDCVDFKVINNMPNETSVHFHGIRQLATPWSDGVPGVSQSPIQPGSSYNYQWIADEAGVFFYHSHYKGQISDGLYGAIVITAADNTTRPFSLISSSDSDVKQMTAAETHTEVVLTSDWNSLTFNELFQAEQDANIDASCVDSFVLNGMGSTYCLSAAALAGDEAIQTPQILNGSSLTAKGCIPPSNIAVQGVYNRNLAALPPSLYDVCTPYTGKNYTYSVDAANGWASMSFISPASSALFRITIDGHKLFIYEVNGNYIQPQEVDQIEVDNGDRVSVMIKLDQPAADYTIRVANFGINQVISGFGVLSYKGSKGPSSAPALMNYGGQNTTTISFIDRADAAPFSAPPVSTSADVSFVLDIMKNPEEADSWAWVLNGLEPYNQTEDDLTPLLFQTPSSIPNSDLILRTNYNQWVDLIVKVAGPLAEPHPMHKHANKFYVIGSGLGDFNWTSVAQAQAAGIPFNFANPPYVDGYTTPANEGAGAWIVLRYQANTPGAWLFHCHVQTHLSGGMAVAILDAVDKFPTVPSNVGQTCSGGSGKGTGSGNSSSVPGSTWADWSATATATSTTVSATGTGWATVASGTGAASVTGWASAATGSAASVTGLGSAASGTGVATVTGATGAVSPSGWAGATATYSGVSVATFTGAASSLNVKEMSVVAMVLGAFGMFL